MNKIILAAAALSLSAGVAFAENPNFGINDHASSAQQTRVDYTATATVKAPKTTLEATNPAANRFGDASPANGE
ncbi:hypothetical protein GCM10011491_03550 [Brucella endophytica]|uniref:DUF680 domain-containing protein n=1 Tax=Brucella endophytica TaxID=1963359 RepID=A0A916W988_9HYPH|nr:hypothetical protein [Brucella endophytica]GGA79601.1 hypothetical protein GCM10011491_03550 [Brucella endophytica]